MGDSFLSAAQELESREKETVNFHQHLPISYLYRHAIELFLKSVIVIFHRRLQLPYGSDPWDGDPMVLVRGKWERMYRTHSIRDLAAYYSQLFEDHDEFLKRQSKSNWDLPSDFQKWVDTIENHDNNSTFFRYPITKDSSKDHVKSGIKSTPLEEFYETIQLKNEGSLTLLIQNDAGEAVAAFNPVEPLNEVLDALRETATLLSGAHVGQGGIVRRNLKPRWSFLQILTSSCNPFLNVNLHQSRPSPTHGSR